MARRRSMYGKKRKINYGRILLLVALLVAIIALVVLFFRKEKYISTIEDVLESNIINIEGTVNSISKIDFTVYSNKGIRYTNQHENIKKLVEFHVADSEDVDNVENIKALFENLLKLQEASIVNSDSLPEKIDGYYWIDTDFTVENKNLIFSDDEEYSFDLFYDKESKIVYIKEEYFSEFSMKNNKLKLQSFKATDEFVNLIEELGKKQ